MQMLHKSWGSVSQNGLYWIWSIFYQIRATPLFCGFAMGNGNTIIVIKFG
jgi:hypothetical protein